MQWALDGISLLSLPGPLFYERRYPERSLPMIDGTTVTIQGKDFIIPPLNFAGMKKIEAGIRKLSELSTDNFEKITIMMDAIKLAIRRNYPASDLPDDEIEEMIDLTNINRVFDAVMGISGVVKQVGELEPGD
jgi:hypothetical protein